MRREDWMRVLSWLLPLGSCFIAAVLVGWQYWRLHSLQKETESTVALIGSLKESIGQWQSSEGREKIPYAMDSRLEEAAFLDGVRRQALQRGVRLVKWVNEPPRPQAEIQNSSTNADTGQPPVPEAVKSVRTLISNVEVAGPYDSVRSFMKDLLTSQRLLTVKTGTWERGEASESNRFNFKLHRYISPAPPPAMQGANASSNIQSGKTQG